MTQLIYYLQSKEAEGLSWTAITAFGDFDCDPRNRFLESDVANRTATIWNSGEKNCRSFMRKSPRSRSSLSSKEARNRCYYVDSVETTQLELLAAVERAQEAKWTIIDTTVDTQVGEASKKLEAGDYKGTFALIRAATTVFGLQANSNYGRVKEVAGELDGYLDWRGARIIRRSSNFYRNRCT
ncbi:hypothetical protein N7451_006703 [Penicillium sp. IBT 35674x]|nr:hypothetical protein N7451_006703 [Penicillium sp. IBT 35674x]